MAPASDLILPLPGALARRLRQLDPNRRMIAGFLPAAHVEIDLRIEKARRE